MSVETLVEELESTTAALRKAIESRSALLLEPLERRRGLIAQLASAPAAEWTPAAIQRAGAAVESGDAAMAALRLQREEVAHSLLSIGSQARWMQMHERTQTPQTAKLTFQG